MPDREAPEPDPDQPDRRTGPGRRAVLAGGVGVVGAALTGTWWWRSGRRQFGPDEPKPAGTVGPHDTVVERTDQRRHWSGRTTSVTLTAQQGTLDLAGRQARTWLYDGGPMAAAVRVRAGDRLHARLVNRLEAATTVHWHGLRIRNDMDGVPDVTMPAVRPGDTFDYRFVVPDPGTYWLHSHVGVQRDRGLYAPLIVTDPHEPGDYDHDETIVLDDWTDGVGPTPDAILGELRAGHTGGTVRPVMAPSSPWGPMTSELTYPLHLANARPPEDPAVIRARPGQRLRLRLINASAATPYRVAFSGHRMTVTHADGWPVRPTTVDTLLIGMAERYDVLVTVGDGAFGLVAAAEGGKGVARAVVRTGAGTTPPPTARPAELRRRLLCYPDLRPVAGTALPKRPVDRTVRLLLSQGTSHPVTWLIDDHAWPHRKPVPVRQGERVRIDLVNASAMAHPIHLHGHTFALADTGVRKDTVVVLPGKTTSILVQADNPGRWLLHCHNAYHMALGMTTELDYLT
ncbi:multicopper oxidase MmcO [Actinocatenispora thailandica]|uniref:Multicopper oxidase MmcO n=1 Tax=Actinocatenispora thailandica TaxID=227318 RepID=A0A7R7HVE4_9ACTN|nr:multicopper oxidase family protein [Actinocatenispora thailandica]BCJ33128.1 multicopper oxidase MmcO [Actinocatenispora thailandica]